jgi:hypothetical protein
MDYSQNHLSFFVWSINFQFITWLTDASDVWAYLIASMRP